MFEQLAKYNNHYLQKFVPWLKAEDINRQEHQSFKFYQSKRYYCHKKKCCPTENCSHSTYLEDHAKLAYGWFGLPKLLRELNSDKADVRWRAINSLSEFLLNPYHCQTDEYNVLRRTQNVFLRFRQKLIKEEYREVERLCRIFYILSIYLNGAEHMAQHNNLMNELYTIIYNDEKAYKLDVSKALRNMTEKPEVLDYMIRKTNVFENIFRILHKDWCILDYPDEFWKHLTHLFEVAPYKGVEGGLLEIFEFRIRNKIGRYHRWNMRCYAMLLRCESGIKRFVEEDGVKMLYDLMTKETFDTYEDICYAMMNGLVSKKTLWRAREFPQLPDIITGYAKLADNGAYQITALKTLRLLAEMPIMKRNINSICICEIEQLKPLSPLVDCERARLLCFLGREKWHSDSPQEPLEQA